MYALYLYENDASLPSKQLVQEIINNNNVEGAKQLIKNYNLYTAKKLCIFCAFTEKKKDLFLYSPPPLPYLIPGILES